MADAATLQTKHLVLRPALAADLVPAAAMWANPNVVKHIGGIVRSQRDVWFAMSRNLGMWGLKGFGYLIVIERATGGFVGEVGFADFMRGIDPHMETLPEAGWVIDEPYWGRGYASEALAALHDWFDTAHPGQAACCIIDPGHAASIRVSAKLGYGFWKAATYNDADISLFQRPGAMGPSQL